MKKNKFVTPGVLCTTDSHSSMTDCVCVITGHHGYSLLTHIVSHVTVGYAEDTSGYKLVFYLSQNFPLDLFFYSTETKLLMW